MLATEGFGGYAPQYETKIRIAEHDNAGHGTALEQKSQPGDRFQEDKLLYEPIMISGGSPTTWQTAPLLS